MRSHWREAKMTLSVSAKNTDQTERMREDRYWQAVLAHDGAFDGNFVYAVRSTGIYCRPSCPSRRPRRDQVLFYLDPRAAERAGFRACRRCDNHRSADSGQVSLVAGALSALEAADDDPPTLAGLSKRLEVSPRRLSRGFKRLTGLTPREYGEAQRLGRLKASLRTSANVAAAVYDAGFGSSRAVYERAPSQLGMTPGAYRRGGEGMRIGYTTVDSPLGRLLIGATERGVCSVCLGDSDGPLQKALRDEYPRAEIVRDGAGLDAHVRRLQEHLAGRAPALNLPVDVQATAFQWRVWQALREIPYGETRSYSHIARAVGSPRAIRAVGRACASNPVAVVIPCHRAVRQDGGLGGYRWGIERKQALLDRERIRSGRRDAR
jgi:AraC family transcriptional regulator, regulatory protein of adaptative response / methylated-DNA-[protein]-cysteine methyltransferase